MKVGFVFTILQNIKCRWVWIVAMFLLALPVHAANGALDVQLYAPSDDAKVGAISREGLVRLALVTGGTRDSATLTLNEFADSNGNTVAVTFQTDKQPAKTQIVKLDEERMLIELAVDGAVPGITYSGELWIKVGTSPVQSVTLTLKRALPVHYHIAPPDAQKLPVSVAASGIARLHLDVRDLKERVDKVRLVVSPFTGVDNGREADVYLAADGKDADYKDDENNADKQVRATERLDLALTVDFLPVRLDASDLPVGQKFVGVVTLEGNDVSLVTYVELTRHALARNADPALDQASIVIEAVCIKPWGGCTPPSAFVLLNETGGDEPLVGVYASGSTAPAEPADAKVLSPASLDVQFEDAGKDAPSLFSVDPTDLLVVNQRTVPRSGQRLVRIQFKEALNVGLYKTKLKFGALNADLAQLEELAITVRVERHWGWALLVLTIGVVVSYLMSKGVTTMQRRAELRKQICKLRQNYWLRLDRAGTQPIVRARARIAKLREAMVREKWLRKLAVPRIVKEEVMQIEEHLPYLERLSACIAHWDGKETFKAWRARKAIRVLVNAVQSVPLETKPDQTVEDAIAEMEQWQDDKHLAALYVQHLKGDIDDLLVKIDVTALGAKKTGLIDAAFVEVYACVPDPVVLIKTAEKLKTVLAQALGMPHLQDIATAFETLSPVYKLLRDAIAAAHGELAKMTSEDVLSPIATVMDSLKQSFEEAKSAEAAPVALLYDRLPLVTGLTPSDLQATVDEIHGSLGKLVGVDDNKLAAAMDKGKQAEVDLSSSARDVADHLLAQVEQNKGVTGLREGVALEKLYSALKVIWENKDNSKLTKKLLDAYRERRDPEVLFKISDDAVWESLQDKLEIVNSHELQDKTLEVGAKPKSGHEVYQPITFNVSPTNTALGNNFLFKHGLSFHWNITMPGRPLTPVTSEPTVTQFIPWPCKDVKVDVAVRYKRKQDPINVKTRWISTVKSDEFKVLEAFSGAEMIGVGLGLVFAVVTGLNSEYLKADLLGSFGDYVALFVWGFVADQAKNILQNIGTAKGDA